MSKKKDNTFESLYGDLFNSNEEDDDQIRYSARIYQENRKRPVEIIPIDSLEPDPDNKKIYGDYKTDGLADSIRQNGFRGVIFAYQISVDPKKYRIESGHRSLEAAQKAGLKTVPVVVTEAPKNDTERRRRLILANLHGRIYTPSLMASQVAYLYDTYSRQAEELKVEGKKLPKEINEMIAADLEVSRALVLKYRQLLSLSDDLKAMADSGDYSWSALAQASSLTEHQQQQLKEQILAHTKAMGKDACTRKWIEDEIREFRYVKQEPTRYDFDPRNILQGLYGHEEPKTEDIKMPAKRTNGAKAITKSCAFLEKAVSKNAFIGKKAAPAAREQLLYMRGLIDRKLKEMDTGEQKNA